MSEEKDLLSGLVLELRRGTLVLSVLSLLKEPRYGYALVQNMEQKGIMIDPSTLYPLLRRLDKQGLLYSSWDTAESKPRKYYHRSELGNYVYENLKQQWATMSADMDAILKED